MDFVEFQGKTVEEALTEACEHFGKPSDSIEYEVVDEGKSGFLGIGSKPAVIKAKIKENKKEEKPQKAEKKAEKKQEKSVEKSEKKIEKAADKVEKKAEKPVEKKEPKADAPKKESKPVVVDEAKIRSDAEKFLKEVFDAMKMEVNVKTEYIAEGVELSVELSGEEMGVLIGKRGQTLDSLQYLTSLVVNKNTASYVRVKIDTEDYRRRRKDTLENLAKNISFKVKKTRRSLSLEPMNPYERRIIHSALQGDKYVTTHSEGEEPFRRVVVTPKRQG